MSRRGQRLSPVVAGLLAASATLVGGSAEAAPPAARAAGCTGATGVTVVVDFNELGGLQVGCDPDADGYAAKSFGDAGFSLARATRDQSFVCRVNGLPSADVESCADASSGDRYWSLWVSDGKSGSWAYATRGVDSLRVPAGGYIAFSWDQVSGNRAPDHAPTPRQAAPSPSPSTPAGGGSGSKPGPGSQQPKPGGKSTTGTAGSGAAGATAPASSASTPAAAAPTASPSATPPARKRQKKAEATPSVSATTGAPASADVIAEPGEPASVADGDDDGFPVWAAGLLAVLVLGAAGAVPVIRSRR